MTYVNEDVDKFITENWNNLSKVVQRVIIENTYREVLQKIIHTAGVKNEEEVLDTLSFEVLLVLVGLQSTEDFAEYVHTLPLLTEEKGDRITSEIDVQLFSSLIPQTPEEPTTPTKTILSYIKDDIRGYAQYRKFPESVQSIVSSFDAGTLTNVQGEISLSTEQQEVLYKGISEVIVGLKTTKEFADFLMSEVGVNEDDAKTLSVTAEREIFTPVRSALLKVFETSKEPKKDSVEDGASDPYREPIQ